MPRGYAERLRPLADMGRMASQHPTTAADTTLAVPGALSEHARSTDIAAATGLPNVPTG